MPGNEEEDVCTKCGAAHPNTEHILWECPQYDAIRQPIRERIDQIMLLPNASKVCGWPPPAEHPLADHWSHILGVMEGIIMQYEDTRTRTNVIRRGAPNDAALRQPYQCSQNALENQLELLDAARQSDVDMVRPVERFRYTYPASLSDKWPYSRPAYNRLVHFLHQATFVPDEYVSADHEFTILEFYLAYLEWNKQRRFPTLQPDLHDGSLWTHQLWQFLHAVQQVSVSTSLQPPLRFWTGKPQLAVQLRVPHLELCRPVLRIPQWDAISRQLVALQLQISRSRFDTTLPPKADTWRHAVVGIPESQCILFHGDRFDFAPMSACISRQNARVTAEVYNQSVLMQQWLIAHSTGLRCAQFATSRGLPPNPV
eukprot:6481137-Amphidinium_carterae.1